MIEQQFISDIQAELTISGALPVTVTENEIKRLIRQESKYFLENYEFASYKHNYIIKLGAFNSEEFRSTRTIQMPPCVHAITRVQEVNGAGRMGTIDRDFSETRLMASEIFLSSFHGDDLVLRVANYQWYDLNKAFFLDIIQFDFNKNTKKLKIIGRNPKYDVYIETWNNIAVEYLYEDYMFTRWITAKAKISFARIVGTYPFPLPGNVTVNADMWRSEGEAEIAEIKEKMNAINTPDWFMIFH